LNVNDIKAAQRGSKEAFARLLSATSARVMAITFSICRDMPRAEELAQETFVAAWQQLNTLEEPERFVAWVSQIARNKALHTSRTLTRRRMWEVSPSGQDAADPNDPRQIALGAESRDVLTTAMSRLDTPASEILTLFYWEGQSIRQVALLLELSESAVKKRLSRARGRLRDDWTQAERALAEARPGRAFAAAVIAALTVLPLPANAAPSRTVGHSAGYGLGVVAVVAAGLFALASGSDPSAPPDSLEIVQAGLFPSSMPTLEPALEDEPTNPARREAPSGPINEPRDRTQRQAVPDNSRSVAVGITPPQAPTHAVRDDPQSASGTRHPAPEPGVAIPSSKPRGSISYYSPSLPTTLNPLFAETLADDRAQELVFDRLFYLSADSDEWTSRLATEWTLDSAKTELRVSLRDDVRWHDGRPLRASDVCFTVEALRKHSGSRFGEQLTGCEVSGNTAKIRFESAASAPEPLASFPVLPGHLPSLQSADDSFAVKPIGTGPMKAVLRADHVKFRAFENGHHKPRIATLMMVEGGDELVQVRTLYNGGVDGLTGVQESFVRGLGPTPADVVYYGDDVWWSTRVHNVTITPHWLFTEFDSWTLE